MKTWAYHRVHRVYRMYQKNQTSFVLLACLTVVFVAYTRRNVPRYRDLFPTGRHTHISPTRGPPHTLTPKILINNGSRNELVSDTLWNPEYQRPPRELTRRSYSSNDKYCAMFIHINPAINANTRVFSMSTGKWFHNNNNNKIQLKPPHKHNVR